MAAVPNEVAQDEMQGWLAALRRVVEVHDLHIWSLSTTETALTAHLVYVGKTSDRQLHDLSAELQVRFGIGPVTLQIVNAAGAAQCR
jgi:cobalt-zinc-cadmium efflux system protein